MRFPCADGPEPDGHEVNRNLLIERRGIRIDEARAAVLYDEQCWPWQGQGR